MRRPVSLAALAHGNRIDASRRAAQDCFSGNLNAARAGPLGCRPSSRPSRRLGSETGAGRQAAGPQTHFRSTAQAARSRREASGSEAISSQAGPPQASAARAAAP